MAHFFSVCVFSEWYITMPPANLGFTLNSNTCSSSSSPPSFPWSSRTLALLGWVILRELLPSQWSHYTLDSLACHDPSLLIRLLFVLSVASNTSLGLLASVCVCVCVCVCEIGHSFILSHTSVHLTGCSCVECILRITGSRISLALPTLQPNFCWANLSAT